MLLPEKKHEVMGDAGRFVSLLNRPGVYVQGDAHDFMRFYVFLVFFDPPGGQAGFTPVPSAGATGHRTENHLREPLAGRP